MLFVVENVFARIYAEVMKLIVNTVKEDQAMVLVNALFTL